MISSRILSILLSALLFLAAAEKNSFASGNKTEVPVYTHGDMVLVLPDSRTIDFNQSVIYTAIHFRWKKTSLEDWYKGNDEVMKKLSHVIDSLGTDRILSVEVVSQSSPEGSTEYNNRLSERRAASMYRYMRQMFPELVPKLNVSAGGESWAQLRTYVEMDTVLTETSRNRILALIDDDITVNQRKARMQRLGLDGNIPSDEKDIYKYLLRTYYPLIRNSAIFINYKGDRVLFFGPDIRTANAFRPIEAKKRSPMEKISSLQPIRDSLRFTPHEFAILPREQKTSLEPELPDIPRPLLAVKTNLLLDAAPYIPGYGWAPVPNMALEYFPGRGNVSFAASLDIPWWKDRDNHRYFEGRNWQLEARWYHKPFSGFFLYAYAHACMYAIGYPGAVPQDVFDVAVQTIATGVEGEGAGTGLGIGYTLPLGRRCRWSLELSAQAGYFVTRYDPFLWGDPVTGDYDGLYYYNWTGNADDFVPRQYRFTWLGPTRAGITLRYDLVHRKQKGSR